MDYKVDIPIVYMIVYYAVRINIQYNNTVQDMQHFYIGTAFIKMTSKERHELRYQRRKYKRDQKVKERSEQYSDFESVFGTIALVEGYKKTSKASKYRPKTQIWMNSVIVNSRRESNRIYDGTWKSKGFNSFNIFERGKSRDILSVDISEKGIQNSFCNNCVIPIIRPHLIYDNGASMKGKGTDFALDRLEKHLRDHYRKYGRNGGIFFFDFSSYFANIRSIPLIDSVHKKLLDQRMFKMYKLFIDAFNGNGLGLGSQVSQISAVFYPNRLDHMLKDDLSIHGYGRYMDDGYIICNDIDKLKKITELFYSKCEELGIIINKNKCQIIKLNKQFIFLKTRFFITEKGKVIRRLNRQVSRKERNRLKAFKRYVDNGTMAYREAFLNFHSWLLSLNRGKSYHTKLNMIIYFNNLFKDYGYYWPIKIKNRKHKLLLYLAKTALLLV